MCDICCFLIEKKKKSLNALRKNFFFWSPFNISRTRRSPAGSQRHAMVDNGDKRWQEFQIANPFCVNVFVNCHQSVQFGTKSHYRREGDMDETFKKKFLHPHPEGVNTSVKVASRVHIYVLEATCCIATQWWRGTTDLAVNLTSSGNNRKYIFFSIWSE